MVRDAVLLLVALLVLWIPCRIDGAEGNIVPDPSFENSKALDAWSVQRPNGTTVRLDRAVARSGKSSVLIETLPGHEQDSYPAVKFRVRPKPGERYRAEVWIKSQCKNHLGGFIVLETTRGGKRFELIDGDQPGPMTDGWVRATAATVVAAGAEELSLALVAHGTGRAWFDDVTFVKVADAPPQPPPGPIHLEVRPDECLHPCFEGFGGGYGDLYLWTGYARSLGVNANDIALIANRIKAMRPHIARLWYGYEYEPEEGSSRRPASPW